jgi:cell division protein FtsQ
MSARKAAPRRAAPRQSTVSKAPPVAVPVSPRTAWRLILGSIAALGGTAAIVWAVAAGLPRQATLGLATASSEAGFVVRQVEIEGATNQPRLSIYREVLDGGSDSMLLADLDAMRERLVALPWVKDANIQRRWPDRLHIHIVERQPAAIWQYKGRLRLIDAEGAILPAPDLSQFARLPLLVGEGARTKAPGLLRIVAGQPQLARDIEAAQWVGQRRWDIRMKSGETISLPEGPAAEAAFLRFADIHRETPLLGRGFVRFDLRIPDKMVVRVAGEPGQPLKPRAQPPAAQAPTPPPAGPAPQPPMAMPQANAPVASAPTPRPAQTARRAAGQPQEVTI